MATQTQLIEITERSLNDKKETITILENKKNPIDQEAYKDFRNFRIAIAIVLVLLYMILGYLIWQFGWSFFEPGIFILSLLPPLVLLLYLLRSEKEWSWNPKQFLDRKKEQYKQKKYRQFNFDINHLNKLKEEVSKLEQEIDKYKSQLPQKRAK